MGFTFRVPRRLSCTTDKRLKLCERQMEHINLDILAFACPRRPPPPETPSEHHWKLKFSTLSHASRQYCHARHADPSHCHGRRYLKGKYSACMFSFGLACMTQTALSDGRIRGPLCMTRGRIMTVFGSFTRSSTRPPCILTEVSPREYTQTGSANEGFPAKHADLPDTSSSGSCGSPESLRNPP